MGYIGQSGNFTNPFCKASDKFCESQVISKAQVAALILSAGLKPCGPLRRH
ncbi:Putative outer membrane lipoprotein YmcA [Vibrio vulnificus]|nr:Putative outer membrane lipoprotein YmcA [Vibrio vulnificus]